LRKEVVERFGGLTAFSRTTPRSLDGRGETMSDDILVLEIVADALVRKWWAQLRRRLERGFAQEVILIRATEAVQL
jgi:hypothetical protein